MVWAWNPQQKVHLHSIHMAKQLTIAIDGPAAAGKTVLAEKLAQRLGYLYFDTGAMYRAVTLAALRRGIDANDAGRLEKLANELNIDLRPPSKSDSRLYDVIVDGEDWTWEIRSKEVDANVSAVSAVPGVRNVLSRKQRAIGLQGGVVMAGRDIGTVVLPEADLKVYLDATPEERAKRRYAELLERGEHPDYEQVLAGLRERDKIDSSRDVAPLKPAPDALILKSDGLDREQVVEKVLGWVEERRSAVARGHSQPYQVAVKNRIFRTVVAWIFRQLFRILCRIEIIGRENVPDPSAYIIAYNHVSYFEPPLVLAFWPHFPEAVAGADVFDRSFVKFLVRGYGAIPVRRGEYDRQVIEDMLWVLASNKPLMIAPEGGRGHELGLRQARAGVAYLMDRARVPVVPVGIVGTYDDMLKDALRGKRPHLAIHIGKPFDLPPISGQGEQRRAARQANADLVMRHIAAVLPQEYWGAYMPI